ncbi:MAG TPA: efflux RND transporter periplasmic adaptor subunit [Candidatus Angelobacter sp.]|nr:efflux RND transporter periplasmic adaptor subunit [Candidatus Angelobacter sp.]
MPSRIKTLWTNSWIVAHRDTTRTIASRGSLGKRQSGSAVGKLVAIFGVTALIGLLAGCASVAQSKPQGPVQVSVAQVACRQFGETDEFTGRLDAVNTVEVRPRVSGYLESVNFKEGTIVRQGALLFQIDPRPFQAEVDRLKGDLAEAKAALLRTQSDFERAERLHNNNGMSAEEYDRRAAARSQAEAHIASTQAALKGAELNLEFTRITAPITGRVGRAEVTAGNLVGSGPAQVRPLTTVVSLDPIYAYFDADEQTFLKYARVAEQTAGGNSHELKSQVALGLADEEGFPHIGRLNFVDNQVSSSTGTIRVRATLPNKDLALTPGLFARLKIQSNGTYKGCLAKDEAIATDLNQKYVLALDKNNALEYRVVKPGPMKDGLRVIRDGLHDGDLIVVNGLQRVRPGVVVKPVRVSMAGDPTAASAATSSTIKP